MEPTLLKSARARLWAFPPKYLLGISVALYHSMWPRSAYLIDGTKEDTMELVAITLFALAFALYVKQTHRN